MLAHLSMKALVWHGGRKLGMEELPEPQAADGEVVLDVGLAGICGSDLHPFKGHHGPRRPPLILGHEVVGTVAELPGRWSVFPLAVCGTCAACRAGCENLCPSRQLLGLHRPGVFAERVAVPRGALLEVPEGLDDSHAALVEPLAVCVGALASAQLGPDSRVLVIGCGPIGLLSVFLAARLGAEVIAVEPVDARRDWASRLGAERSLAAAEEAEGLDAELTVDAVGAEATWRAGIAATRAGGEVVIVGLGQAEGSMPVADLVRRSIRVRGQFAYTRAEFAEALAILAAGGLPTGWLEVMPLSEGPSAFARLADAPDATAKILLQP